MSLNKRTGPRPQDLTGSQTRDPRTLWGIFQWVVCQDDCGMKLWHVAVHYCRFPDRFAFDRVTKVHLTYCTLCLGAVYRWILMNLTPLNQNPVQTRKFSGDRPLLVDWNCALLNPTCLVYRKTHAHRFVGRMNTALVEVGTKVSNPTPLYPSTLDLSSGACFFIVKL